MTFYRFAARTVLLLGTCLVLLQGCVTNPATGESEISFVSEAQEISMGQQADPQATAQFGGLYADESLQAYVTELGMSLAAVSERPNLPWSFKLVDHELINAFAIPGGFVYITRGILANMNSEAELVAVLGHEAGHVTARHSAQQITQQQLGMIGLIGGSILSETVRNNGQAVMQALQLLSLQYSRADEAQADELGYRYMLRTHHDPRGISSVMRMLQSTSPSAEEMGVPGYLLSHPDPGSRVAANERRISRAQENFSDYRIARNEFLGRLDGLVYGEDPRQGYFIEQRFIQPGLAFELTFPPGWEKQNSPQAVQAAAPQRDALMQLAFADVASAEAGLTGFTQLQGVTINQTNRQTMNGIRVAGADFSVSPQPNQTLHGYVLYAEHGGSVYRILGYAPEASWQAMGPLMAQSIQTFRPVTDNRYKNVSPHRIDIVSLPRAMTAKQFLETYRSTVDDEAVLLANQVSVDQLLEQGRMMKRVTGGDVPTQ